MAKIDVKKNTIFGQQQTRRIHLRAQVNDKRPVFDRRRGVVCSAGVKFQ